MCIALPPEIDVATLDLRDQRRRRHGTHLFAPLGRFRPASHRRVRKDQLADDVWILWIDLLIFSVCLERFLPFALAAFNRGDQPANISIVRR